MAQTTLKLRPQKRFWKICPRPALCHLKLPPAGPKAQIIASNRVVQAGEPFDIKVIASSSVGLSAVCWFGHETGISEIDEEHWQELKGQSLHEEIWKDIVIDEPGIYTLAAKSRDPFEPQLITFPQFQIPISASISKCTIEVRDDTSYDEQINITKSRYRKTDDWETWMKSDEIRFRYENAWELSRSIPTTLKLAFHYYLDTPIAYDPPWEDEGQHMEILDQDAALSFPGLNFEFLFGADPDKTDVHVEAGPDGGYSTAGINYVYLYYETIFAHEFGHVLNILHHYEDDPSTHIHLPPNEVHCIMARNANQYCSGCRAAMHLDLDADNGAEISALSDDILSRVPY